MAEPMLVVEFVPQEPGVYGIDTSAEGITGRLVKVPGGQWRWELHELGATEAFATGQQSNHFEARRLAREAVIERIADTIEGEASDE
jgi:hypothetical protein